MDPDCVETPVAPEQCGQRLEFCEYWLVERNFDLNGPVGAVWADFGVLWLAFADFSPELTPQARIAAIKLSTPTRLSARRIL